MTPEQWQQVREVLGEALEQKTEDRPPFLDRACSSNPWLREEVERLLSSSDEARSSFLQSSTRDGRFLYYSKDFEAPTSLWKVAVEGGEETLVLEQIAFWSTFAVGDAGIHFFTRLDMVSGTQLEFLDFATSRVKTIANIDKPWIYGLTVSPDGRYILFTRIEQQGSDLMLVESFH
jgi:hypothetical protein